MSRQEESAPPNDRCHPRRRIPSSGIIWRDGLIVSASRTVRRDGRVPVTLPSGESLDSTVVARDSETDLVILRADGLPAPAQRATSNESSGGSLVLAIGRPGRATTASFGIVSATIDGSGSQQGRRIDGVLRLDLSEYDGFSGGPLTGGAGAGVDFGSLVNGVSRAIDSSDLSSGTSTAAVGGLNANVPDSGRSRRSLRD